MLIPRITENAKKKKDPLYPQSCLKRIKPEALLVKSQQKLILTNRLIATFIIFTTQPHKSEFEKVVIFGIFMTFVHPSTLPVSLMQAMWALAN